MSAPGGIPWGTFLVIGAIIFLFIFVKRIFSKGGLLSGITAPFEKPEELQDLEDSNLTVLKNVTVDMSKVSKTATQIQNIVNDQYQAMRGWGTDTKLLFDSLTGLNREDLRWVYKEFGIKPDTLFLISIFSAPLFGWYNAELGPADKERMKIIWAKTDLW